MSAISPPQSSRSKQKYTNLCYTGTGANKNPQHTKKQFMRIMNQTFTKRCREHKKSLTCKSCKNAKKFSDEISKKTLKNMKKHKLRVFQYTDDDQKKYLKKMEKCNKCKKKRTRRTKKCNIKDYIEYSGAEEGMCE
jgi:hypothetical protein